MAPDLNFLVMAPECLVLFGGYLRIQCKPCHCDLIVFGNATSVLIMSFWPHLHESGLHEGACISISGTRGPEEWAGICMVLSKGCGSPSAKPEGEGCGEGCVQIVTFLFYHAGKM